ncbi:MAG: hypothetical protein WD824_15495 [Cyclobacteriaceae bacterium]
MKKLLLLLLVIPLSGLSQTKNVLMVTRIHPKAEKTLELEKAITAHAQKFHTGDWKWRVYQIITGPEAGGYHIVEGFNNWTTLDGRGNLGPEHNADLQKNVAPFAIARGVDEFSVYREDLSSVQASDFSDKVSIIHMYPRPGHVPAIVAGLKKMKKVWETGGESIAVYETHFSGERQIAIVNRLKEGWKEYEQGFRKPFPERYIAMYGESAYQEYLKMMQESVSRTWGEMLTLRPDMGSK